MSHIPVNIPDTMTRDDVGPYLLGLRKHFGLSEQDVSDRLHIRVRYLLAMEAGDFAQLPTVVYARGYLHTYAEFLGLNADQVVERCFGEEAPAPTPILPQTLASRHADWSQWRAGVIVAVVGAVLILIVAQLYGRGGNADAPEPVAAVPENVLGVMRTMAMPTVEARDCLNGKSWSACMTATRLWQTLGRMQSPEVPYNGQVAITPFMLAQRLMATPLVEAVEPDAEAADSTDTQTAEPVEPAR
jgi:hypothetical protein